MHCNGKCHLKKQLSNDDKKEKSPASPLKNKNEVQFFSEINSNIKPEITSYSNKFTSYYSVSLSEEHLQTIFHPPIV